MNIYVGNLPHSADEGTLKGLFEGYGEVITAKVIKDRFTGEPRGFGFVEMPSADEAQRAITELNGREVEGRRLRINEARPPQARPPRGGNGAGGNGGGRSFR